MKFIRRKNLQEGEELLYTPVLHWMYPVKHLVLSLPFFLILLILWINYDVAAGFIQDKLGAGIVVRNVFLAALVFVLLIFVWRIFKFLCCEYGVTNKRLIIKKGIIRLSIAEIAIDRIESMYFTQGLMGRLFRYGTIRLSGVGGTMPAFYMVNRPYALRRKIIHIIEKNKTISVFQGDIPRTEYAVMRSRAAEEEPVHRYGTFVRMI